MKCLEMGVLSTNYLKKTRPCVSVSLLFDFLFVIINPHWVNDEQKVSLIQSEPSAHLVLTGYSECLNRVILFGEASLRRALRNYIAHYHSERNHQGVENRLLKPLATISSIHEPIKRRERLGSLLNYYYREAA